MKHLLALILLIGTIVLQTAAQQPQDLPANSAPFNLSGMQLAAFDNRYEGIRGYYTFLENFVSGEVELTKKQVYTSVQINYDAVSDNLIVMSDKLNAPMLVRKDLVQRFVLHTHNKDYYFEKIAVKGSSVFMIKLATGKFPVYCKVTKRIKEADFSGAYKDAAARYDEFITMYSYYLLPQDGDIVEIGGTKKSVLKQFPQQADELNVYFKANKVDFKNIENARNLFEFLNTLDPE